MTRVAQYSQRGRPELCPSNNLEIPSALSVGIPKNKKRTLACPFFFYYFVFPPHCLWWALSRSVPYISSEDSDVDGLRADHRAFRATPSIGAQGRIIHNIPAFTLDVKSTWVHCTWVHHHTGLPLSMNRG